MAALYAGSAIGVSVIFAAIEIGKLATAASLHRYWPGLSWVVRIGLMVALLAAMLLTSAGVYGYLLRAYLSRAPALTSAQQVVASQERLIVDLEARLRAAPAKINLPSRISSRAMTIAAQAQAAEQKRQATDRMRLTTEYQAALQRLAELRTTAAEVEVELGPARTLATWLNLGQSGAVEVLTLISVLCLDPLAVLLMMAGSGRAQNLPIRRVKKKRKSLKKKVRKSLPRVTPTYTTPVARLTSSKKG